MRCRHFTIRLTSEHAREDEARLNEFLQGVQVHSVQTGVGAPGSWSILVFYEEPARHDGRHERGDEDSPARATAPAGGSDLTPMQQHVYDRLREWRARRASAEGRPAYVIANNAVLMQIARQHMTIRAAEDLLAISQFGPARAERYGPDIIQLLATLAEAAEVQLFEDA